MNPAYEELLKNREAIGSSLTNVFGGKDIEQFVRLLKTAAQEGNSVSSHPINARVLNSEDANDIRFIHTVVPISDTNGLSVHRLFVYSEKVA